MIRSAEFEPNAFGRPGNMKSKKINALLVYPLIPDTFWNFKHILKIIHRKAAHPPLGLLTVANLMPQDWNLRLVDMNMTKLSDASLHWADVVFVSAMLVQKEAALSLIRRCKKMGKRVVAGGPLFHSEKELFADLVDHLVLGEAETSFPSFIDDFVKCRAGRLYESKKKPELKTTPLPRWDLIKLKHYASMSIQYSRGCPFNCEFCDVVKLNGRKPRTKSPEQMLREFDALYKLGWRGRVFVVDDNFIGNAVKVKSMLRALITWQKERKYPFTLYTEASVNLALDEELMTLMTEAGFDSVFLGLETPEESSLKECGKHQNRGGNLVEMVKVIHQHGIEVMGGFILGFDNDPPGIFDKQIDFISQCGVMKAMVGLLQALPGTQLYDRLKREGRLLPESSGDNTDGSLNFITKMDVKAIKEGYARVMSKLYSPREYYERASEFLKQYKPVRRRRIDLTEIMAFLRSLIYIGILDRDRGPGKSLFWKFLIRAFIFHRRSFGEAVASAIYGYHFRRLFVKRR